MPAASVGVFRNPDFTRLFLADSLSQLGAAIAPIALPLAAIGLLHANAFQVGLLTVFETAAFLLIGLPAGAWVDRARRRPVMLWANTGRLLALGAVPLLWRLRVLTMPELLAVALVVGVLTVFFECAYQSYLPRLVEAEQLVDANARLQSAQSVARIAGPGLAGLMIGWLGAPYALLATAGGYGWAVLCVLRIRRREPAAPARPGTHLGQEIAEGLRFLFGHWLLLRATVCTSTFNFFYMMGEPMLVLVLARELRFSPSTIGVVFACGGVGGVLGSFLVNRLVERFGRGPALWGSAAVAGVAGLAAPLAGHGALLVLVCAGQAVAGVAMVVFNVSVVSYRQATTPDRLLGRVSSAGRVLVWGSMPLGGLVAGVLGQAWGARPTLWIAALGGASCFLVILFSPLRTMRELPVPEPVLNPEPAQ
ncbi:MULTISPECIES: MFS transporter [Kitasatospora]|uniref:MFS transporter n=1 Tax=Kitasatospora TaxID=2063 RepID=UPI000C70EF3C|nr:MFS transporter [Kitasatospora sp. GP30]MDH6140343.1 MFS family permease [Kitasatospora sp. GP30]